MGLQNVVSEWLKTPKVLKKFYLSVETMTRQLDQQASTKKNVKMVSCRHITASVPYTDTYASS